MNASYAELHCHTNYSFHEGASSVEELLMRSKELGHRALAITDHDNLCGAMHFAQVANSVDVQAITGAEVTLKDGSHLTLLAETRQGYSNLSRIISYSYISGERRDPGFDLKYLPELAQGLILLTGCRQGRLPRLLEQGHGPSKAGSGAQDQLGQYLDWFGTANVFVELQQNLVQGDTRRNRQLVQLAGELGVGVVATNNVHYHIPERHRLQDALVAIQHNLSLDETHQQRRPNGQFYLKSREKMAALFQGCPEALENTLRIAGRCDFDLTKDLGYQFPDYPVPQGFTPVSYLESLCHQAAQRRYGGVSGKVKARLDEEFRLIERHNLAGFLLIYYEIIQMARQIMIELGLSDAEIPLEERPPGRGRGSSVSMLVGYLIGLSHIDPLEFNLSLDRFLADDMGTVPDIDLDFPRNIREELIKRVHQKWGWDHAALSGMISTYRLKGAIRDLGKALGLPSQDVDKLAKRVDGRHASALRPEMLGLPEFRDKVDAPVWRHLIDLALQLDGFPKYLAQHPGGMIISSSPLIDIDDQAVYEMMHQADTIGIFQVESAAQMQTVPRIKPRNLTDMAYEVGAVRPGVGVNDGVSQFIQRRSQGTPWDYDHPLERRSLERTLGIILFQDQVNHVAMDVAGFSAMEADQMRRAFTRRNNQALIGFYREKFLRGAWELGVAQSAAEKIFKKFNGHYMFPESHAFAFGATAYHMAWLKYYYHLEFSVAIFNQQPMGFYNRETLKEDAKRHGIAVLNPDINESIGKCTIKDESLLLGFLQVRGVGEAAAESIVGAREKGKEKAGPFTTPFTSLADAMERTGLQREAIENLVNAGAFDSLITDRRAALWEVGLRYRPGGYQQPLPLPVEQDMPGLPPQSQWEAMAGEYRTMGVYPRGHLMAMLRKHLPRRVSSSQDILDLPDGTEVTVAGLVIRRQRPLAKAVFLTLEDEFGHTPLVVWPQVYEKYRLVLREAVLVVRGEVSRREGTMNVLVKHVESANSPKYLPKSKDWG